MKVGTVIRVLGTDESGTAQAAATRRTLVKSVTIEVTRSDAYTITGIELRKDGSPRMVGGIIVERSIVAPTSADSVYVVISEPVADAAPILTARDVETDQAHDTLVADLGSIEAADRDTYDAVMVERLTRCEGRSQPWRSTNGKRKNTRAARRRTQTKSR